MSAAITLEKVSQDWCLFFKHQWPAPNFPFSITAWSNRKVMRRKEMITRSKTDLGIAIKFQTNCLKFFPRILKAKLMVHCTVVTKSMDPPSYSPGKLQKYCKASAKPKPPKRQPVSVFYLCSKNSRTFLILFSVFTSQQSSGTS